MRALLVIIAIVLLLVFAGWMTFSTQDGNPTVQFDTQKAQHDTQRVIDETRQAMEHTADKVDDSIDRKVDE
jgi:ABC-type nickel/cobalt efflux system permease component RcnA